MQDALCSLPIGRISPPAGAFIRWVGIDGHEFNGKNIILLAKMKSYSIGMIRIDGPLYLGEKSSRGLIVRG